MASLGYKKFMKRLMEAKEMDFNTYLVNFISKVERDLMGIGLNVHPEVFLDGLKKPIFGIIDDGWSSSDTEKLYNILSSYKELPNRLFIEVYIDQPSFSFDEVVKVLSSIKGVSDIQELYISGQIEGVTFYWDVNLYPFFAKESRLKREIVFEKESEFGKLCRNTVAKIKRLLKNEGYGEFEIGIYSGDDELLYKGDAKKNNPNDIEKLRESIANGDEAYINVFLDEYLELDYDDIEGTANYVMEQIQADDVEITDEGFIITWIPNIKE